MQTRDVSWAEIDWKWRDYLLAPVFLLYLIPALFAVLLCWHLAKAPFCAAASTLKIVSRKREEQPPCKEEE